MKTHLSAAIVAALLLAASGSRCPGAPAPAAETEPKEVATLRHGAAVASVAFSPDSKLLACGGDKDRKVKLWEVGPRKHAATFDVSGTRPAGLAWVAISPDGKTVAASSPLQVWDVASGENVPSLPRGIGPLAYSSDGKFLAFNARSDIRLYDLQKKVGRALCEALCLELTKTGVSVRLLTFTAEGKLLFVTVDNNTDRAVVLWDAEAGKKMATFGGGKSRIYGVALSGDAKVLASMGQDNKVRLWDVATGKNTVTVDAHVAASYLEASDGGCPPMALSPDGKLLAIADLPDARDSTERSGAGVRVYEVKTGKELAQLKGHKDLSASVVFSPDGKLLATGSYDGTVKLWSLPEGWAAKKND